MKNKRDLSPILLFVYNRPDHTILTINSLLRNRLSNLSDLIIFSDGPKTLNDIKKVEEVRKIIHEIKGFNSLTIIKRKKNIGLADSIIDGVTKTIKKYKRVIVLEDDLVTSPHFLSYMNDSLEAYSNDHKVGCIHGYVYPLDNINSDFFIKGADCWGWATWERSWDIFEKDGKKLLKTLKERKLIKDEFNVKCGYVKMLKNQIKNKNNSWAVRWYFSAYLNNLFCLYPKSSFIKNIGFDGSGTHCNEDKKYSVEFKSDYEFKKISIEENKEIKLKIIRFLNEPKSLIRKIFKYL